MDVLRNLFYTLLVLVLTFAACNKSNNDVNFQVTYLADLVVEIPPAQRNFSFSAKSTIDPLSDENVEKYANTIKSYDIDSLVAGITYISKNVRLVNGMLSMTESSTKAVWQFSDLQLSEGARIPLGNENGQWEQVKEIFGRGKIVDVKIEGETDDGDVNFSVQVKLDASVIAGAL